MNLPQVICCGLFLVSVYVTGVPHAETVKSMDWLSYKEKYGKEYLTLAEDENHRKAFEKTKIEVIQHNEKYKQGIVTYWMNINHFADMLPEDYEKIRGQLSIANIHAANRLHAMPEDAKIPKAVDWRKKGWVTKVKNQGGCGSCFAFASVAALESQHKNVTGKLVELSEQNALDCSENEGCVRGGDPAKVYEYIINNKGIDTRKAYPYEGHKGECRFKKSKIGATMTSFAFIPHGSEKDLTHAVATRGPVAVGIVALESFEKYEGGVYYEPECKGETLNHAVLVVGYNTTEKGEDYYIVKNSYGSRHYGMKGYIRMARNRDNNCRIADYAIYPIVEKN